MHIIKKLTLRNPSLISVAYEILGRISLSITWYVTAVSMPINETLILSPKDDLSIQNTDQDSITITIRGIMTKRKIKKELRCKSILIVNVDVVAPFPISGVLRVPIDELIPFRCH